MTGTTATTTLPTDVTAARQPAILGKVLGLLSFSFLFTAAGAYVGFAVNPGVAPLALAGGIVTLLALVILRKVPVINIGLLYAYSTLEGLSLAPILDHVIGRGFGGAVAQAAFGTAAVALAAGCYGVITKRDLSGLRAGLSLSIIALVVGMAGGLLLHLPGLWVLWGGFGSILFTGYIVYDLNAAANSRSDEQGESIMLAVNIYLDFLNLFLFLLQLFSGDDDSAAGRKPAVH